MRIRLTRTAFVVTLLCVAFLPPAGVRAEDVTEPGDSPALEEGLDDARSAAAEANDDASEMASSDEDANDYDVLDDEASSDDGESAWQRSAEISVDVLLVRPLSLAKLIAGAGFVYPASVIAAPNTTSVREEVVEVLWTLPLEDLTDRKLGEF